MKDLLIYILKNIVDNPEEVTVEEVTDETGLTSLNASVAETDMGRVIGKGGKVINAIRQVVKIKAIKEGKRVNINLREPDTSSKESKDTASSPEEPPQPSSPKEPLKAKSTTDQAPAQEQAQPSEEKN